MKNKQIIDAWRKIEPTEAAQERMLDNIISQTQTANGGGVFRFVRLSTAAAVMAVCLAFATVAYAVIMFDGVNVGSGLLFSLSDRESPEFLENINRRIEFRVHPLYINPNAGVAQRYDPFQDISDDFAQFVSEAIEGRVFTANGEPLELPNVEFITVFHAHMERSGELGALYDENGDEIGTVHLVTDNSGSGVPFEVEILTLNQFEERFVIRHPHAITFSYEKAVAHMGRDIRLPNIYPFGVPPEFTLSCQNIAAQHNPNYTVRECSLLVSFRGGLWSERIGAYMPSALTMRILHLRDDAAEPTIWLIGEDEGEITEFEIAGTTVYRIVDQSILFEMYYWQYDGLHHMLHPTYLFTVEQILEIIGSMVD